MKVPHPISTKDVAKKLSVTEQQVRNLLRSGKIKGEQFGKQWLINPTDFNEYLKGEGGLPPTDHGRQGGVIPKVKAFSFFSGAMGLDIGLEKAGIHVLLACENDKACRKTIARNRPDIALLGDVWNYSAEEFKKAAGLKPKDTVDLIVGGPPCQSFSTAGARRGFKDQRGNALLRYVELILDLKPRYAVIENVRGLLSAPLVHKPHSERGAGWNPGKEERPGGAMHYVISLLRKGGYQISFNLYNSANFGVPQVRERVVIICHRGNDKVPHLMPTNSQHGEFGLKKWITLRDAIWDIRNSEHDHVDFPEKRLRYYRLLKPGQYWKHLPKRLQVEALGNSFHSGGGKTGFFRRLDWKKPSCTLVTSPNMPATDICHPEMDRPLSIQEYKRVQQFPDSWVVCGSLSDQYRQIGNAVPVGLGTAIGRTILAHMNGKPLTPPSDFTFSRYVSNDEVTWEEKFLEGQRVPNMVAQLRLPLLKRTKLPQVANRVLAEGAL